MAAWTRFAFDPGNSGADKVEQISSCSHQRAEESLPLRIQVRWKANYTLWTTRPEMNWLA